MKSLRLRRNKMVVKTKISISKPNEQTNALFVPYNPLLSLRRPTINVQPKR